jgi:hypothetical protein
MTNKTTSKTAYKANNKANKPWSPKPEKSSESVYNKTNHNFISAMEKTRESIYNLTLTENGAVAYKTSGSKLVDLNFAVASLRGKTNAEITKYFRAAFNENPILAMRWLFYARDIRQGLGERNLFRVCLQDLAKHQQDQLVNLLVPYIAEYGRWDDLFCLLDTKSKHAVFKAIKKQWKADLEGMNNNQSVSLMAKWLPSEQASNEETKKRAKIIASVLKLSPTQYRKKLSALRKYLDVVERKMSSNNWQAIDYEAVPSQANLRYNKAFFKHDAERRSAYLEALNNGEAKINSSVAFPHDIVYQYTKNYWKLPRTEDPALEAMWKSLPDMVQGESSTIVVADGSGSMTCGVGNTNVAALDVANALAIYFAERCKGEYKNTYITFSRTPQIVRLNGGSLLKNLKIALTHSEISNTNIEAVFDLILKTAQKNRMSQADIPANVLIVSDMEFDNGIYLDYKYNYSALSMFDAIRHKYEAAGYKLPRLIFWNVNSRTKTIPMRENDLGVTLVSGFSTNICKLVMSNKTDPYEALVDTLNSKRYDAIEEALRKVVNN